MQRGRRVVTHDTIPTDGTRNSTLITVRPKVAELTFQLYGRALHPELFQIHQTRVVERAGYRAKIDITSAGHVINWRVDGITLTEVAAAANQPLPKKRLLMGHHLRGECNDRLECRGGVTYQVDFCLEPLDAEMFWSFQEELVRNSERQGMLHTFDSSGRIALGALSYIHVQTRERSMMIQAFHTFPDDHAIVKTQSVFELPGKRKTDHS